MTETPNKTTLKMLQTKLSQAKGAAAIAKMEVAQKQREYQAILTTVKKFEGQIEALNAKGITVSEHAIVRYLERIKGVNIQEVEKEILTEGVLELIKTLGGNGAYPADGFSVRLKDNVVVTIIPDK